MPDSDAPERQRRTTLPTETPPIRRTSGAGAAAVWSVAAAILDVWFSIARGSQTGLDVGHTVCVDVRESEERGLGLLYGMVRLARTELSWSSVAARMIAEIRDALGGHVVGVEHVGSTAVPDMLAKPIIDIAILMAAEAPCEAVVNSLTALGYEFRGDAGDDGGLVFVLDARPRHRVAHLHAIGHSDPQWSRYLAFRDLLRSDPVARSAYERAKRELATAYPADRKAYTAAKQDVIERLMTPDH